MANQYEGWQYEYSFTLSNAVASGDQILVTVDYQDSDGIPMKSDFSDIRFSDGTNKLSYWIIPGYTVAGESCICVVKLASTATTLYLHWGNASATSESTTTACENGWIFSGVSIPSGWGGTGTVADGCVTVTGQNSIQTSATFGRGYELITMMRCTAGGAAFGFGASAPWYIINCNTTENPAYYQLGSGTTSNTVLDTQVTFDGEYHNFRLQYLSTEKLYVDSYQAVSNSNYVPNSSLPLALFGVSTEASINVVFAAIRKIPSIGDPTITWGTITDYFAVAPTAAFSGTPLSGTAPLQVQFTDESVGLVTSWSWTFGDGQTSTEQNPLHRYTSAGTYNVTLTATNSIGSTTETKNSYVVVSATGLAPVAAFSANSLAGPAPLGLQFTDASTGTPTSWLWDFGDGATSTDQSPTHAYTAAGVYNVKLTVTNASGSNAWKKLSYITVTYPVSTAYPVRVSPEIHPVSATRKHSFNILSTDGSLMSMCSNPVVKCSVNGATETDETWTISDYNSTMLRYTIEVIDPGTWKDGDNIEISVSCDEGLGFLALTVEDLSVAKKLITASLGNKSGVFDGAGDITIEYPDVATIVFTIASDGSSTLKSFTEG